MNIILPIHKRHIDNILNGSKLIELRKKHASKEVNWIYMYETVPTKKIVGKFKPLYISGEKTEFWEKYGTQGILGVTESEFFEYFKNSEYVCGYYVVDNPIPLDINPYEVIEGFSAPQNFVYCENLD